MSAFGPRVLTFQDLHCTHSLNNPTGCAASCSLPADPVWALGCSGVLALLRVVTRHCHPGLLSWQPEGEPETGPVWELKHRKHLSFFETTLLVYPTWLKDSSAFIEFFLWLCQNHLCSFQDHGNSFTYTGSGGRDLSGNKRTAEQSCDQKLTNMNRLAMFVLHSTLRTRQPVSMRNCLACLHPRKLAKWKKCQNWVWAVV